ncbi:MAG: hypothetical protein KDB26_03625 [Microthrixaceae bacterium]|nr:hypothetical protein [Microthrixaceae bacterium]
MSNGLIVLPVLALALVAVGCIKTKPKASADGSSAKPKKDAGSLSVCSDLAARAVGVVMGGEFKIQPGGTRQACSFVDIKNPDLVVSVEAQQVANGDSLNALVTAQGVTRIESNIPDEVFITESLDQFGHRAVVRRGGYAAVVRIRGIVDESDLKAKLVDLARAFSSRLANAPYDSDVTLSAAACDSVDIGALAERLSVHPETLQISNLAGETGCSVSSSAANVGGAIRVEQGQATAETLEGRGGSIVADGETFVFRNRPVEGVGTAAIWQTQSPQGDAGELLEIYNGRLIRVSAAGGSSEDELVEWAVAVAEAIAPVLVG